MRHFLVIPLRSLTLIVLLLSLRLLSDIFTLKVRCHFHIIGAVTASSKLKTGQIKKKVSFSHRQDFPKPLKKAATAYRPEKEPYSCQYTNKIFQHADCTFRHTS